MINFNINSKKGIKPPLPPLPLEELIKGQRSGDALTLSKITYDWRKKNKKQQLSQVQSPLPLGEG